MRGRSVIAMRLISAVMQSILPLSMRSQNRPAPCSWTTPIAWSVVLVAASACKPDASRAPRADLDNIAAIESELAANAARLQAQGVPVTSVAQEGADAAVPADPVAAGGAAPDSPEPEPEPAEPPPAPSIAEADEESMAEAPARDRRDGRNRRLEASEKRAKKSKDKERTRCERICDLADSTCDLAGRICALAEEHVDDVRYEEACDNAEAQCEAASEACETCED